MGGGKRSFGTTRGRAAVALRAKHGQDVQAALSVVWSAANGICAKRLVPFLPELIPTLERHGHLVVTDTVRGQLLALSPATVDRLLRPLRQPHGLSTTNQDDY